MPLTSTCGPWTRIVPLGDERCAASMPSASVIRSRMWRHCSWYEAPSWVRATRRVVRWSSFVFRRFSSAFTCSVTDAGERLSALAAPTKLPFSTTLANTSRVRRRSIIRSLRTMISDCRHLFRRCECLECTPMIPRLPLLIASALLLALASSRAGSLEPGLPDDLRATGLDPARPVDFAPEYPLWSDGTSKRRWLQLPAGTSIDASNPDAWEFPRGTKAWKEFSHAGRVETRLIERLADGTWRYSTYA